MAEAVPPPPTPEPWRQMVRERTTEDGNKADFTLQIGIFGDTDVGKTSMMKCYVHQMSMKDRTLQPPTIGADMQIRHIVVDGYVVKAVIWDTAGMEKYQFIALSYVAKCQAIILVYDVNRPQSCANILQWVDGIQAKYRGPSSPLIMVVGNKCDLEHKVKTEEARRLFHDQLGFFFVECSAYTGDMVDEAFNQLCAAVFLQHARFKLAEKRGQTTKSILTHRTIPTPLADYSSIPLKKTEMELHSMILPHLAELPAGRIPRELLQGLGIWGSQKHPVTGGLNVRNSTSGLDSIESGSSDEGEEFGEETEDHPVDCKCWH
jgi:small GTP-binding protein